ncbi:MAG: DUF1707 domain-containing protein [Nocardioidaceae bacterium]
MSTGPEVRIGDAEREGAVSALSEHYAAGRLTKEEFDERSDRAWASRTAAGLWPLFEDLPGSSRSTPTPPEPRHPAPGRGGSARWPARPWSVALAILLALVLLSHLPLVLFVLVAWLVLSRSRHGWAPGGRGGHGGWCGHRR